MDNKERRAPPVLMMVLGCFMIVQVVLDVLFVMDRAHFRTQLNQYLATEKILESISDRELK